jgi:hypothetical protein
MTVLHVGLTAWNPLDVLRVRQEHLKVLFKYVPHWLPIDSGRFHGNMLDTEAL